MGARRDRFPGRIGASQSMHKQLVRTYIMIRSSHVKVIESAVRQPSCVCDKRTSGEGERGVERERRLKLRLKETRK